MKDFIIGVGLGMALLAFVVALLFVGIPAIDEFVNSLKRKEEM